MFGVRSQASALRLGLAGVLVAAAFALGAARASAIVVEPSPGKRLSYAPAGAAAPFERASRGAAPLSQCYGERCVLSEEQPLVWNPGGLVMPSTTTYFIYWDPKGAPRFPKGYESGITTYFKGLANDSGTDQNQYSVLTQYYGGTVPGGTPSTDVKYESRFGKALTDKNPYPATVPGECELSAPCVSTAQIEAELQALVKANKLPPEFPVGYGAGEEPRIAYFVLFPPGVNTCFGAYLQGCSGRDFCAYHSFASGNATEGFEVFAVEPYDVGFEACDSGQHPNGISDGALSGSLVHEHAEMITDPYAANWLNDNPATGDEEVADICSDGYWASGNEAFAEEMRYGTPLGTAPNGALYNQVVDGRDYYYQQMYSNETESCQQRRGLAPVVSKLSVKKGPAAGGTEVTITGINFKNPDVTAVHFGAFAATSVTIESGTSLTAQAPPGTAGAVSVTVTTSAGTSEAGVSFKFENPAVTAVSPAGGSQAGGEQVTVTGSGFALGGATSFVFGKAQATSVNCASTTSCTMIAPPATKAATVDVRATAGKKKSKKNPPADQYAYS